ncbi:hypothetical protein AB670_00499 [Chryseobacterium sp. MOF25P]|jgi:hypothetical protein|uniref:hypothetical protein n=1 Tax=unclassified Chryseobacterium TaxID=2593645 RepID=UPI0008047E5A|nr:MULTISPECIES: hypothetical protein [unclassified Chryseobacterium]MCD0454878.1 hypothetical protein [Chryseobacterium sp. LC2016-27]OBW43122.1 hypothetical protein AB670_00499 [Chryseobacterium sp. MOF25P]OBW45647.1 hypothetical protein AB671_02254 [Chryseobacterium sp. BGARF1]
MIFKESRPLKSFISKLMLGIYFFALFSSSFHSHESSDFKHFNLKKTENSISKTDAKEKAGDCLACHFLATANTLVPEEFSFTLIKHTHEVEQIFAVQEKIWSQTKFSFQLRGPPAIS